MNLKTDYRDEILKQGERRKYKLVDDKGNVFISGLHLEKDYIPLQEGDDFGAVDVNNITKSLNLLPISDGSALPISKGGTGGTHKYAALKNLGLLRNYEENVYFFDADANKYTQILSIPFKQRGIFLFEWGVEKLKVSDYILRLQFNQNKNIIYKRVHQWGGGSTGGDGLFILYLNDIQNVDVLFYPVGARQTNGEIHTRVIRLGDI